LRGRPQGSKNKSKCSVPDNVHVSCTNSPLEQHVGKVVGYYLEGERAGYLLSYTDTKAKVKPIAAYKGVSPHSVTVPIGHLTIL